MKTVPNLWVALYCPLKHSFQLWLRAGSLPVSKPRDLRAPPRRQVPTPSWLRLLDTDAREVSPLKIPANHLTSVRNGNALREKSVPRLTFSRCHADVKGTKQEAQDKAAGAAASSRFRARNGGMLVNKQRGRWDRAYQDQHGAEAFELFQDRRWFLDERRRMEAEAAAKEAHAQVEEDAEWEAEQAERERDAASVKEPVAVEGLSCSAIDNAPDDDDDS
ncbi:hypothetical protein DFH09DRAFT_1081097 [Mycena vulgaris]|nr:hypothetical protein DFH09DRAFT_1081097 [Mycena vulgaris]